MRTGGHWSEPAARRVLKELLVHGGEATTWQLAVGTRSVAVHQDIYSLRCLLQFVHGYSEEDTHRAVETVHQGESDTGRQVVLYRLREDVKRRAQEWLSRQAYSAEVASATKAGPAAGGRQRRDVQTTVF